MIIANIQIKTMMAAPMIPARLSGDGAAGLLAGLVHHVWRNQRESEGNAGGDNDKVIEVAEDGIKSGIRSMGLRA